MPPHINSTALDKTDQLLFLADFRRKQQSPVHLVLPERHSGHNASGGNGPVLPFFGCARAGIVRRAQLNSRGQKFTSKFYEERYRTTRGLTWANSSLDKEHASPSSLCFYWWNISFTDIFQQWNTSPARQWTPQKGGKIHTLIHLLDPPFSKCVLKKKKQKQNTQLWRTSPIAMWKGTRTLL